MDLVLLTAKHVVFHYHSDAMGCVHLYPFYRWENQGLKRWNNFSKFPQPANGRLSIQTQANLILGSMFFLKHHFADFKDSAVLMKRAGWLWNSSSGHRTRKEKEGLAPRIITWATSNIIVVATSLHDYCRAVTWAWQRLSRRVKWRIPTLAKVQEAICLLSRCSTHAND